ncbi:MAG: 4Fe-4S dicluster domain-containing protein [Proteobacteria bacterium]|nr:4Fe-4S dicluster domain-containing protein [Pseudomonadota bacterium]
MIWGGMDFFDTGLALSLTALGLGLGAKALSWLRLTIAPGPPPGMAARLSALARSLVRNLAPHRAARWGRALVMDGLLQRRIAGNGVERWLMHLAIFAGFMGLLIMHGLDELTSERWFAGYAPALDPYQWLRNLFGVLTLGGLAVAVWRRRMLPRVRRTTGAQDWALIALLGGIMISGLGLEAAKIISPQVFDSMVEQYLGTDDEAEINDLRLLWSEEYGVIFLMPPPHSDEALAQGREAHEGSCVYCHSRPTSAFVSYPLAKTMAPLGDALNNLRADLLFYYLHVGLCFLGLALLPWGKFMHPLSAPLNLTLRQGRTSSDTGTKPPALAAVLRPLGLDACTHCGACSEHCSVAPAFLALGTPDILPSEKLSSLKRHAAARLRGPALRAFAEGSQICTECLRCTTLCPSGIDLQDLWMQSRTRLRETGPGEPHLVLAQRPLRDWAATFRSLPPARVEAARSVKLCDNRASFWGCIQCTTCTSVCPVVAASQAPARELDLTPQQIMNMLRMGLKEEALGAEMVWSCVTCYKCQENCPQGVRVADVLYELRTLAWARLREHPEAWAETGATAGTGHATGGERSVETGRDAWSAARGDHAARAMSRTADAPTIQPMPSTLAGTQPEPETKGDEA